MYDDQILSNFITELNRGTLTLCVLSQLRTPQYGYALLQTLAEQQIVLEANTLYPMLRRLESQGVLKSSWDTTESRPRKFYQLSEDGVMVYERLKRHWLEQHTHIQTLLKEEHPHG
jgi:DNA-binding PadR family transcriptional regulator